MGLYYRTLIKKLKEEFKNQGDSLGNFLNSKKAKEVYKDFSMEDGVLWALNLRKLSEDLDVEIESGEILKRIESIEEEESKFYSENQIPSWSIKK